MIDILNALGLDPALASTLIPSVIAALIVLGVHGLVKLAKYAAGKTANTTDDKIVEAVEAELKKRGL